MENIEFIITDDGSTGLYNKELGDIYHSKTGAQKESIEKFIIPSNFKERAQNSSQIRVLDICYGIGYNSKNALSFYKNCAIYIDALEWDKRLVEISPKIPFYMSEVNEFLLKKPSPLEHCEINFYIDDARKTIKKLYEPYDVIFLDAFSPNKLPTLWSVEFFYEIARLLKKDGVLATYCSAQPVRKAMSLCGLSLGKVLDEKAHSFATVGAFDKNLIKLALDDFDLGLMNTRAGIPYRDAALCQSVDEIFATREKELAQSTLIGASKFIKNYNSAARF